MFNKNICLFGILLCCIIKWIEEIIKETNNAYWQKKLIVKNTSKIKL